MTGEDFKQWRKAMGYRSRQAAGEALGYSGEMVKLWESKPDRHPVPLVVRYAMTALYHRLAPWGEAEAGAEPSSDG